MAVDADGEVTIVAQATDSGSDRLVRTTASQTIGVPHLAELLAAVPSGSRFEDYSAAVVDDNVLGRPTFQGRRRALRHLRELYGLDERRPAFRALRVAWADDPASGPLLAVMLAFAHDDLLQQSWPAIREARTGSLVTSQEIADALTAVSTMSPQSIAKAGRNLASSWSQSGHLVGRTAKRRVRVVATPTAVAYAVALGHLSGARGAAVLETRWFELLDLRPDERREALDLAHRRGLVDVRAAGTVLEIGVGALVGGTR